MTRSFALTKDMRAQLAFDLTSMAIAKHGKPISAAMKKLNDEFWSNHIQRVESILQVDQSRWRELILAGLLQATTTCAPSVKGEKLCKFNDYVHHEGVSLRRKLLRASDYDGVTKHLKRDGYNDDIVLTMVFTAGSLPALRDMHDVELDRKFVSAAQKITTNLAAVFEAANDFHSKATDILNGCRTSRQLLDIFPEAAKLLPEPMKKATEVVPAELAKTVRNMLATGVPNLN